MEHTEQELGSFARRNLKNQILEPTLIQALEDLDKAIELNPSLALAYASRAGLHFIQSVLYDDSYQKAEEDIQKALQIDANCKKAYFIQGNLYREKKDYKQAIDSYSKAIEIDRTYLVALKRKYSTYKYLDGDWTNNELHDLNEIIELDPTDIESYINRADNYQSSDKYESALADQNKAIELAVKEGNKELAEIYYNRGCFWEEYQYYNEILALEKEYDADLDDAELADPDYELLEKYESALDDQKMGDNGGHVYIGYQDYNKVLAQEKESFSHLDETELANPGYEEELTDFTENAIADFTEALKHKPSTFYAICCYTRKASLYDKKENKDAVLDNYDAAVNQSDKDKNFQNIAYKYRADFYKKTGNYQKALADYKSALKSEEDQKNRQSLLYSKGEVYEIMGVYQLALADYHEIIDIKFSSTYALSARSRIDDIEAQLEKERSLFGRLKNLFKS